MKTYLFSTIALIGFATCIVTAREHAQDFAASVESDTRLHDDGKGWRLDRARITDPDRPRVLLIGDSILTGYLDHVVEALDGVAYVDAWVNPHYQSERLNRLLAEVLGRGPYDVIHFNVGLHGWQKGRIKDGAFEPLTRAYVEALRNRAPQAKLVWANSTPVTALGTPARLDPEINPIIVEHNRMADGVMAAAGVPSSDFYSLLVKRLELTRGDQFHWKDEAYKVLAEVVVTSVKRELGAAVTASGSPEKRRRGATEPLRQVSPPNIVFILADDVGWGDLGSYGATKTRTPNLDRLAGEGVRFTRAYASAPACSASRYALLTGRNHWRDDVDLVISAEGPLAIQRDRPNLPSLLKAAGYTTGVVGKWHLGFGEAGPDWNGELAPGPLEVGFDHFYGFPVTNGHVPCVYIDGHNVVGLDPADPIRIDLKNPLDDGPTGETPGIELKIKPEFRSHAGTVVDGISRIGYMSGGKRARWKDEEITDTLTREAVRFIEANRDERFFLYFATHDVHAPFWPHRRFRGASQSGNRGDALFALDWSVGEVLTTLDRLGLRDNTLVIFSSDNGAGKVAGFWLDPGSVASGHKANAPWRGGKGSVYEGGLRVPFVVRWPSRVPAGVVSDAMFGLVDMTASLASLAGQAGPHDAAIDSVNVLPALMSPSAADDGRRDLVCSMDGERFAIWHKSWKMHMARVGADASLPVELYDLAVDPAETKNIADQHPEVVRNLASILRRELARGGIKSEADVL